MIHKTIQYVSVLNLNLFGPMMTELWTKEVGKFLLCYMGKRAGGYSLIYPPIRLLQYKVLKKNC